MLLAFTIPAIPELTDWRDPWQLTDPFKSSDVAQKIERVLTIQECRSRPEQRDVRARVFIATPFENKYFLSIVAHPLVILFRRSP